MIFVCILLTVVCNMLRRLSQRRNKFSVQRFLEEQEMKWFKWGLIAAVVMCMAFMIDNEAQARHRHRCKSCSTYSHSTNYSMVAPAVEVAPVTVAGCSCTDCACRQNSSVVTSTKTRTKTKAYDCQGGVCRLKTSSSSVVVGTPTSLIVTAPAPPLLVPLE